MITKNKIINIDKNSVVNRYISNIPYDKLSFTRNDIHTYSKLNTSNKTAKKIKNEAELFNGNLSYRDLQQELINSNREIKQLEKQRPFSSSNKRWTDLHVARLRSGSELSQNNANIIKDLMQISSETTRDFADKIKPIQLKSYYNLCNFLPQKSNNIAMLNPNLIFDISSKHQQLMKKKIKKRKKPQRNMMSQLVLTYLNNNNTLYNELNDKKKKKKLIKAHKTIDQLII